MILVIDTSESKTLKIGLGETQKINYFIRETKDQSSDLLCLINLLLEEQNAKLKDLKSIYVNLGPGSFTGIRAGVAVANTLAWSLNIPVFGFNKSLKKTDFKKNTTTKFQKIVLPYYP
jgi:tRNA threonylcarbamoyladenosine biosynthesis protein TsaB